MSLRVYIQNQRHPGVSPPGPKKYKRPKAKQLRVRMTTLGKILSDCTVHADTPNAQNVTV